MNLTEKTQSAPAHLNLPSGKKETMSNSKLLMTIGMDGHTLIQSPLKRFQIKMQPWLSYPQVILISLQRLEQNCKQLKKLATSKSNLI